MMLLPAQARSQIRGVMLPAEHGGWAFWLEPSLLGLLVAPSLAGVWLALAGLAAFLLHQPVKIALKDWRSGRRYARTQMAEIAAVVYSLAAVASLLLALANAGSAFLTALLAAIPFAGVQLAYDAAKRGREAVPEICGALALGALASMIVIAGGGSLSVAIGLWMVAAARAVTSILYVRARLRLEKGKTIRPITAMMTQLLAFLMLCLLAAVGNIPFTAALAAGLWLARAAYGLSRFRQAARPRTIGVVEIVVGLVTVALVAAGYATR